MIVADSDPHSCFYCEVQGVQHSIYNWICLLHLWMESFALGVLLLHMTGSVCFNSLPPLVCGENIYFEGLIQDISSVFKSSGLAYKIFLLSAYANCSSIPHTYLSLLLFGFGVFISKVFHQMKVYYCILIFYIILLGYSWAFIRLIFFILEFLIK